MKFANGMFGACICVIALLGTAIGGYVLNVEEDTREVTKFDYIADVSGLFSYSDAPEYIAYNPSTNYVGYEVGSVEYTPTPYANNYRYTIANGSASTESLTVTNSSDYPGDYGEFEFGESEQGYVQSPSVRFLWDGAINFGTTTTLYGNQSNAIVRSIGSPIEDAKVHITQLSNIIDDLTDNLDAYEKIDMTVTQNSTYPVLFYTGSWSVTEVDAYDGYFNAYYTRMNESNAMPDRLVMDVASYLTTAYRDGTIIWQATADNVGVLAWYSNQINGYSSPVTCSATLTATLTENSTYGYMNPNAGVKVTSSGGTWSNGYENGVIDLKISKNGDANRTQGLRLVVGGWESTFYLYSDGDFEIHEGAVGDYSNWTVHEIGKWLAVQLHIDALSGNITLTPTNDVDLTRTTGTTSYSIMLENVLNGGTINTIGVYSPWVSGTNPSLKFQITDTMVFLNTYNTVMIDPVLNIIDYFPQYEDYRLNFYSFALLGDSITINGRTMAVNKDNGTVTFEDNDGYPHTKKLENFYITFNEGRTSLSFVNDGTVYDLGKTTTTTVSFGGMWFFVTGLYETKTGIETFWNWGLNGTFQANAGECLIIFLGIIGVGIIAYLVWGKGRMGWLDWLVIAFAVFIGSSLLGF